MMLAAVVPLAHAGHYLAGGLYLLPALLVGGLLWLQGRRERRADARKASKSVCAPSSSPDGLKVDSRSSDRVG